MWFILITLIFNPLTYDLAPIEKREQKVKYKSLIKKIGYDIAFFFQWFGNLVTMRWWNDLWLNEGFANFVQDEFGADHVLDGWNMVITPLHCTIREVLIDWSCSYRMDA